MDMNEITGKIKLPDTCQSDHSVLQKVTATANLDCVSCQTYDKYGFEGRMLTSGTLALLILDTLPAGAASLIVNSEKMVTGTVLVRDMVHCLIQ